MTEIISTNADNRPTKLIQVIDYTILHRPIVVCIQDCPRITRDAERLLIETNYNIVFQNADRPMDKNENTILVYKANSVEDDTSLATRISLTVAFKLGERKYLITSIYVRPRTSHAELITQLKLIEQSHKQWGVSRSIIMGDTNATGMDWAPSSELWPELDSSASAQAATGQQHYQQIKMTRGQIISKWLNKLKMNILNDINKGPTFISCAGNNAAHIDIAACGQKANRTWSTFALKNDTPGHRIISIKRKEQVATSKATFHIYKLSKIDSSMFTALNIEAGPLVRPTWYQTATSRIKNRIDNITEALIKHLLNIQNCIRTKRKLKSTNNQTTATTRAALAALTARLKNTETIRRGSRTRNETQKKKARKLKTKIIRLLERKSIELRTRIDNEFIWDNVHNLIRATTDTDSPGSTHLAQSATTEELEAIVDQKIGTDAPRNEHLDMIPTESMYIFESEIDEAINRIKGKKFTGPEGLKFSVFNKTLPHIRPIIVTLIRMCFAAAYVPKHCKTSMGTLVPKKAHGQFRIVHICSPILSLLEQVALNRLEHLLEEYNLHNKHQFGFRTGRGRHELITRILEMAVKHRLNTGPGATTHIVSLDIKGAFDNVDQTILANKILEQLAPSPLAIWLVNFLRNRSIKVRWGETTSKPRALSKGVPQGSSLGPILWNLSIADINQNITLDGTLEVLAYADDLYVVYNGDRLEFLQLKLNELVNRLAQLRLQVEPTKCSRIVVRQSNNIRSHSRPNHGDIIIEGKRINTTYSLPILGVVINNRLQLDTKNATHNGRLRDRTLLMAKLKRLDITNSATEWRSLTTSYIDSIIINNNLPVLGIDPRARKWADKQTIRALKRIYEWPYSTSNKLVKLVTGTPSAHARTYKLIATKAAQYESTGGYTLLKEALRMGSIGKLKNSPIIAHIKQISNIDTAPGLRRHHNPTIPMNLTGRIDGKSATRGPYWILIAGDRQASACEIINGKISQIINGRHAHYNIAYFNAMATLWNLALNSNISSRVIALTESNSLYMAMTNLSSSDWRIIQLREELTQERWRIATVSNEHYTNIKTELNKILKSAAQIDTGPEGYAKADNIDLHQQALRVMSHEEPNVNDYINISDIGKRAKTASIMEQMSSHTTITAALARNFKVWQQIPPSWLSAKSMLMLTGMIKDQTGLLRMGKLNTGDLPHGCDSSCKVAEPHNKWNQHTTLHRAFLCHRFKRERAVLRRTINEGGAHKHNNDKGKTSRSIFRPWDHAAIMDKARANLYTAQRIIRTMSTIAMREQTQ